MTLIARQQTTREQRRYEIARAVLAAIASNPREDYAATLPASRAAEAIRQADALLDALGKDEL